MTSDTAATVVVDRDDLLLVLAQMSSGGVREVQAARDRLRAQVEQCPCPRCQGTGKQ